MNVIPEDNEILNSNVSVQEIQGIFGLVMESRGGAKGKSNERNTDYSAALVTILKRLQEQGAGPIKISVVSAKALDIWSAKKRVIKIDGREDITLVFRSVNSLIYCRLNSALPELPTS
ncbi:hypothetical protein HLV39_06235 [Marinobacter adhaerens]|uniref:Uncharacterized protein n=1 Tax=Marinobacter adhaerens TaxID=1033846 RepID=A0A851HYR8_9GAMM|nr:hypothetical protein [Marinobacter adhaerens]NWN91088.1 hypothetical protein [Marinobacter adhaerens]